jgi:beta-N-acetylhexosaminidase
MQAAIYAPAGPEITPDERAFFRDADAAGYIVFRRNCVDQQQLLRLTDSFRDISGRPDVPVLIDQEGGRVARLKPPHWPSFPAPEAFDRLYQIAPMSAIEAARANAEAMGVLLHEAGINVNCTPLLDLRHEGAHDIVGDRALGGEPMQVAALGRSVLDGLAAAGVAGVVKHMPGHGPAHADSHHRLPIVDVSRAELDQDFAPFRSLRGAGIGMMAHIAYAALDPDRPASLSPRVIGEIIRGEIGFDGLLLSDDIGMNALSGSAADRAAGVRAAGCDIALHCSGDLADMENAAAGVGAIGAAAEARLDRALASVAGRLSASNYEALAAKRDALLAYA